MIVFGLWMHYPPTQELADWLAQYEREKSLRVFLALLGLVIAYVLVRLWLSRAAFGKHRVIRGIAIATLSLALGMAPVYWLWNLFYSQWVDSILPTVFQGAWPSGEAETCILGWFGWSIAFGQLCIAALASLGKRFFV